MSQKEFVDDEVYPVEASGLGINAYHVPGCGVVGHQPAYAACLKKIADRKNGRLPTHLAECSAAIGKKECPAQKLRKEELEKGYAIYFINRPKLRAFHEGIAAESLPKIAALIAGERDPSNRAPRRQTVPSIPKIEPAVPKHFLDVQVGTYADALNAAMKPAMSAVKPVSQPKPAVQAVAPVQTVKPAPAAPVKAGMSLIEMARMMQAAKSQQFQQGA